MSAQSDAPAFLNVLVLGMHRSGTSAVAEALRAAGLNAGSESGLLAPESQNPAGFGERLEVAHFNDQLLESLDWFWDAPAAAPLADPPSRREFVSRGQRMIQDELGGEKPFVLKDPRISALLPWWRQILLDRFVPIVVFRDPAEVAWSLAVRNGFSAQLGLTLYAAYHRHIVAGLAGMESISVDFRALCERPAEVTRELLDRLAAAGVAGSFNAQAAAETIQPALRRATQPSDLDSALADVPAIADIRSQSPADGVGVQRGFGPVAPPTGWERAVLDSQRVSRSAKGRENQERDRARKIEAQLASTSAALQTRLDAVVGERDAARQLASEKQGRYEGAYELQAKAHARVEALTSEKAQTESELRRQVAAAAEAVRQRDEASRQRDEASRQRDEASRQRDESARRAGDLQTQLATANQANDQLTAANVALMRDVAARSRSGVRGGLSPRALAAVARDQYRRVVVRLPPRVIGAVWHNPLFDRDWYAEQNHDLKVRGRRLEIHFRRFGLPEGRLPNRMFHPSWYLEANPDVAASGMNPLDHYLLRGAQEGRRPGPAFDTDWYIATNPDVFASGMNPLEHYLRFGRLEGRTATRTDAGQSAASVEPASAGGHPEARPRRRGAARPVARAGGPELYPMLTEQASGNGRERPTTRQPESHAGAMSPLAEDVRLIALYRSTSDREWARVVKARPVVESQHQPHVPRDLGFYDLRLPESREAQADLAARNGIHAFCYDEAWGDPDAGTAPLREMLATGKPDFAFTLRMTVQAPDGREPVTELSRTWLEANAGQVDSVMATLRDARATTVAGAPMLVVEGLTEPEADAPAAFLRERAGTAGLPGLFLVASTTPGHARLDAGALGVDAILGAQPDEGVLRDAGANRAPTDPSYEVARYDDFARSARASGVGSDAYETVLPGWDDAPNGGGLILTEPTPESYGQWLRAAISSARDRFEADRRFVFVAGWNDWSHGAHLEPDVHDGLGYLYATRASLVAPVLTGGAR